MKAQLLLNILFKKTGKRISVTVPEHEQKAVGEGLDIGNDVFGYIDENVNIWLTGSLVYESETEYQEEKRSRSHH